MSNKEFLLEWGFIQEVREELLPTRAAVLLFGKGRYVRQVLPRAIVDYQRIDFKYSDWMPEKRWDDRLVFEENIVQTWLGLVEKYIRLSESSFSIDSKTLRRNDDPPDYISFREAAINLLIHQDYGDHSRKPVIKFFKDKIIFWNPGDAFATKAELLEASEKAVRNPAIVNAFRRIGLSDQAGTGIRSIFNNWIYLGNTPPEVINKKADKTFELSLLKEKLLSEEQVLFQSSIGVHLSSENASVFAYACKHDRLTLTDIKAITGKTASECRKIGDHLVVQVLLQRIDDTSFEVTEHLKTHFVKFQTASISDNNNQVDDKNKIDLITATTQTIKLSGKQRTILKKCEIPRGMAELQELLSYSNRSYFKKKFVNPLIESGLVQMTKPERPNASDQRYVITANGSRLVQLWRDDK